MTLRQAYDDYFRSTPKITLLWAPEKHKYKIIRIALNTLLPLFAIISVRFFKFKLNTIKIEVNVLYVISSIIQLLIIYPKQ